MVRNEVTLGVSGSIPGECVCDWRHYYVGAYTNSIRVYLRCGLLSECFCELFIHYNFTIYVDLYL